MFVVMFVTLEQFKRMQQGQIFGSRNIRSLPTEVEIQVTHNRIIEVTEYNSFMQFTVEGGQ
jgi:hypothetical protein